MGALETAIWSLTHGVGALPRTFSQMGLQIAINEGLPRAVHNLVMYVLLLFFIVYFLFSLVAHPCQNLWYPMDCSTPGFPVQHQLLELAQTHVHWVGDAIQLSYPLSPLLLPSIFPSIRVFSKESVVCIRWPKYWSFNFSISPFSEYSGLISFRVD